MSLAILFNHKETSDWEQKLKEMLPNESVEVYPNIQDFNAIDFVVAWRPDRDDFAKFPNLKCIQSVGAGIDHLLAVNLPENVNVTRIVDPTLAQDMFEHILTCILNSMKNFKFHQNNQGKKQWIPTSYLSINETNVTVLGLGKIGTLAATKLAQLGFNVKGWSNSPKNIEKVSSFEGEIQLEDTLKDAHFVVNILPLTSKTERILGKELFKHLNNAVLINVGRGKHLNENDLIEAISNNQIKEAYLDVFDLEPLPEKHPFWNNESIFITPHIASITNPNTAILQVVENYNRLKENQSLLNVVDLSKEY